MEFTGKRRHRITRSIFGSPLCILQLQVKFLETNCVAGFIDTQWRKKWIDCKPEWLTENPPITEANIDKMVEALETTPTKEEG